MRWSTGCIRKAGCSFGLLLLVPGPKQTRFFWAGLKEKGGDPGELGKPGIFPVRNCKQPAISLHSILFIHIYSMFKHWTMHWLSRASDFHHVLISVTQRLGQWLFPTETNTFWLHLEHYASRTGMMSSCFFFMPAKRLAHTCTLSYVNIHVRSLLVQDKKTHASCSGALLPEHSLRENVSVFLRFCFWASTGQSHEFWFVTKCAKCFKISSKTLGPCFLPNSKLFKWT